MEAKNRSLSMMDNTMQRRLSMKSRTRLIFGVIIMILVGTLVAGCGSSSVKIGWSASDTLKRKQAKYVTFDGQEKKNFRVQSGETIHMEWEVTVEKGSLTIELQDPDQETRWKESYPEDSEGSFTLTAEKSGLYTLRILGESTGGSYDIQWKIEQ
jgi:major membrane immunogen (membrane-anchored lipoprotein)